MCKNSGNNVNIVLKIYYKVSFIKQKEITGEASKWTGGNHLTYLIVELRLKQRWKKTVCKCYIFWQNRAQVKKMRGEKRKKGKVALYFWVGQSVLVFLTRLGLDSPKISFEVLFAITTSIFYPMLWSKIACYFSLLDGSHVAPSLSEISLWSLLLSHCVESSGAYGSLWRWKGK